MSLLELKRKSRRKVLILLSATLVSLLIPNNTYAETISPIFTEVIQNIGETSNHSIDVGNTNDYDIYLIPHIYKYLPSSEDILDLEPFEKFVEISTDPILVPANTTKAIPFQILGLESLVPGTHYNLITFAQQLDDSELEDTATGITAQNSHIVILNLIKDTNLDTITQDYNIDIQVTSRGIPFLKSPQLKIIFFNNSKYTLTPKGEITVVKHSVDKEPEYIKINSDRDRVYPQDSLEINFKVNNWYLEDILFGKTAYIKIQNGIDNEEINHEIEIKGFKGELLGIGITLVIALTLTRSKRDTKLNSKPSE